jgi:hypothetical protein
MHDYVLAFPLRRIIDARWEISRMIIEVYESQDNLLSRSSYLKYGSF